MRITVVSRIFSPEPSAGSLVLEAVARSFAAKGHDVTVVTARPPKWMRCVDPPAFKVRRARVLRDRQGYVRGYVPYMSFDLPLAFRLLFRRRADLYFVEPPPTTGAVVRVVTWLLRRPYYYRAADIWSDAAQMTTNSRFVTRALRSVERFALRGATHSFAISEGVLNRMRELGVRGDVTVTGVGVDAQVFHYTPPTTLTPIPYFIYAGTHSEWHGAVVFIEAFALFTRTTPYYRLLFVGNGSERALLESRTRELGLTNVEFRDAVVTAELVPLLCEACASLASLRPGGGYDYAFTTKVLSSLAAGCPVIFAGIGPTQAFLEDAAKSLPVGEAVTYNAESVSSALSRAAAHPLGSHERKKLAKWATKRYSLDAVARAVVDEAERLIRSTQHAK